MAGYDFSDTKSSIAELNRLNPQAGIGEALNMASQVYLNIKKVKREELVSSSQMLSQTLKDLNYAQDDKFLNAEDVDRVKGVEVTDGKYNLFDYNYGLAKIALENFTDEAGKSIHKDLSLENDVFISAANKMLAYQDQQRDIRAESLATIRTLADKYIEETSKDPSFTDPGSFTASTAIFDNLVAMYNQRNEQFKNEMPASMESMFQDIQAYHEVNKRNIVADIRTDHEGVMKGIQVALDDPASPALIDFLEKQGMQQTVSDGIATYMPGGEEVDGVMVYDKPDIGLFKEALKSFDKFEAAELRLASDKIVLEKKADNMQPFQIFRSWAEAGSQVEEMMALAIGHEFFEDPEKENTYLSELKPDEQNKVNEYIKDFKPIFDRGQMIQETNDMQKYYLGIQKDFARQLGKTFDALPTEQAGKIRHAIKRVNSRLGLYAKKDTEAMFINIPEFDEGTIANTTLNIKDSLTETMTTIIERDDVMEWWGEASSEEPLLKEVQSVQGRAKWIAMAKLVDKYLDMNGEPKAKGTMWINPVSGAQEIVDGDGIWDADKLTYAKDEIARKELFYDVLQAFRFTMLADPEGTIPSRFGD